MAYLIESHAYPSESRRNSAPYNLCEEVANNLYEEFPSDKGMLVALCDISLNSTNPGITFYNILKSMKYLNFIPNTVDDVYKFVDTYIRDNTKQIQHALMDAYQNGGGIVLLPGGNFRVNGYLVIPPGVELRGINDSAKHYGASGKGTVLLTNYGKGNLNDKPFISLSNQSGINGISIFYLDQSFTKPIVYSDTLYSGSEEIWIYNVTIVNGYTAIRLEGNDFHVDNARGLAMKDFLIVNGVDGGYIENVHATIGDWQDARVTNGPHPDAWKKHPNLDGNRAFYIKNSQNIQFIHNFAFGFDRGLELEGEVNNLISYGTGIDASRNALILSNSGSGNIFINSELVCTENYIWTTEKHSGEVDFINTNNWMANVGDSTINGTGIVRIQEYKQLTGELKLMGGTIIIQNAIIHSQSAKIIIDKDVKEGLILNVFGNSTFIDIINNSTNVEVINDSRGL